VQDDIKFEKKILRLNRHLLESYAISITYYAVDRLLS